MPKKKQVRNGFYWYMQDIMPDLRREGRVFPNGMADVVPVAMPRWKALSPEEKERYEEIARQEKKKMKTAEGDKYRMDNSGNIIAERKDPKEEAMKRRQAESRKCKSRWPSDLEGMLDHKFYFMAIEYLCRTEKGDYLPAEIGMVEFCLRDGITNFYHKFLEPGKIPLGYRFECQNRSEETHKIPIEEFDQADRNFRGIQIQLENFVNPGGKKKEYPPIHVLGSDLECAEYTLELISAQACLGQVSRIQKVFELENMVADLFIHASKNMERTIVLDQLQQSLWDYKPGTRCEWHEEQETKHCALFTVRRYCYAISEILADIYDFQLTESHLPPEIKLAPFLVQPPTKGFGNEPANAYNNVRSGFKPHNAPQERNTKSVWDQEDGGRSNNPWMAANKNGPFGARDVRYQDSFDDDDIDYNMAEVAAPTRTPRMPTADFGAASSAWGMSNIQAGGMEEEQEEWPSLAGGGPTKPKFAGRGGPPPGRGGPISAPTPTTWASRAEAGGAPGHHDDTGTPYVQHKVEPAPAKKMSIHEAARMKEQEERRRELESRAAASPPRPGNPGRGRGSVQPGPTSDPRQRMGQPRKVNAGRGFKVNAGVTKRPEPVRNGSSQHSASRPPMSASHTGWSVAPPSVGASGPDGDFSSRPSDGSSGPGWDPSAPLRPPAGAPAVLTAAPSGEGRLPQSAGMAWGRGATIAGMGNTVNAGIGRGRGAQAAQSVSLPPGLVKPPPGLGRGMMSQMQGLSLNSTPNNNEDFS